MQSRERHVAENEVRFRALNERLEEQAGTWQGHEGQLSVVCECGDEDCTAGIRAQRARNTRRCGRLRRSSSSFAAMSAPKSRMSLTGLKTGWWYENAAKPQRSPLEPILGPKLSGVVSVRFVADHSCMRIVIRHDDAGQWWWAAVGETGGTAAISTLYASRTDCLRAVAELKVEGPAASVTFEEPYAANPGTWTISSLIPSGS